nr:ATP-binding cassette domain-containing protein [Stakelama sediminis]
MLSWTLDRPTKRLIGWAALSAAVAALSSILLLAISGWFLTGAAIAGAAGPIVAMGFNYLIPSATIRLLAISRTVSRYGERLLSHRAAMLAMAGLRGRLFGKLAAQDSRNAPDLSGGDASARLIGDIDALEDLIVRRPTLPASLIAAVVGVVLAAFAGWRAALVLAIALAILPFMLRMLAGRMTRQPARDAAEALGDLRTRYVAYAAARAEIAAYGLADRVDADLTRLATRLDKAQAALFRGEGAIAALLAFYAGLAVALVLIAGAGTGTPEHVALAILATAGAVEAMAALARTAFRQASVEEGLRRLTELDSLEGEPVRHEESDAAALPLRFAMHEVRPGDRIALTGRSGSGKTMLLEGLAGLRPATFDIAVGGNALADCTAATLRDQSSLSPQDAPMLAGSIADNLRLARPGVSEDAMWRVLAIACLDTRIRNAPEGLDTRLGEAGGMLSGGERKRLSLARALLTERPWLLLDEPTEGLDAATEATLIERLKQWLDTTGTGLVLVSHRQAPLALAHQSLAVESIPRLQAAAITPPATE